MKILWICSLIKIELKAKLNKRRSDVCFEKFYYLCGIETNIS